MEVVAECELSSLVVEVIVVDEEMLEGVVFLLINALLNVCRLINKALLLLLFWLILLSLLLVIQDFFLFLS